MLWIVIFFIYIHLKISISIFILHTSRVNHIRKHLLFIHLSFFSHHFAQSDPQNTWSLPFYHLLFTSDAIFDAFQLHLLVNIQLLHMIWHLSATDILFISHQIVDQYIFFDLVLFFITENDDFWCRKCFAFDLIL